MIKQNTIFRVSHVRCAVVAALFGLAGWQLANKASAQGTPWIAEPRTGSLTVSFYNQSATEFYRGSEVTEGPLAGGDLAQNTVWLHANYALNDAMAVDLQTAYARSFVEGARGPSGGEENYSGLYDTSISLTWRFVDELISNAPSVALRVGATIAGGYDTGYINSIGDGASGVEGALIVGKFWEILGLSAEVGYRIRGSTEVNPDAVGASGSEDVDVPSETFVNLLAFVPIGSRLSIAGNYRVVNAASGLEIGGEGFSPSRFPGLEDDSQILGGQLLADVFSNVSANVFYGRVVGGRNTAKSSVIGVGLSIGIGGSFGGGL
ncbi:MAG: hypothetical protein OXM02_04680 [Bacteroidota bacterium]|nr:hypothetical protein [Bacteroidota bacterium]MDE2833798.1 hypothetical protein [Bacteroidota bacterium]MDE2957368.1 hypothetical protein [Bacteroidota bacterium]